MADKDPNGVNSPIPNEPQSPTQPGPNKGEAGKTSPWAEGDPAHDPNAQPAQ